jgi:hypothetical protein
MKKLFLTLSIVFSLSFLGCGGGGGSSSSLSETNSDGSVTKTLSTANSSTKVDMKGENGEKLSLVIPALPVGSEDLEVNFKITYTDGLPKLVIDKDVEFVSGVSFSLQSDAFKDGEFALVYLSEDGTEYSVPYTQDGDTITATLTHFSEYAIKQARTQDTIEANVGSYLNSWEANNASKSIEDIGMASINSLYGDILDVEDSTKRDAFLERFESALLVLASNSFADWKSLKIDYFSKYCMTQEFKDTITYYQTLYIFFGKFSDDIFEQLQFELAQLVKTHLENSYRAWSIIFVPDCDAIDTPAYVKCASDYDYFVDFVSSIYFNGTATFSINNDIMGTVESKIISAANSLMNSSDACDCLLIYKTIILEYFHTVDIINNIDLYLTNHCENSCPFLWNISYSHSYTSMESGDPALDVANASFKNVLIYPRGDYYDNYMSLKEEEACSAYIDDNGHATQTSAVTYSHTIDGYSWDEEGAPSFYYSCISASDCGFRDSKTDTPFNKLDAGYISGESLGEDWKQYGYPRAYLQIEEDIFEEIYKRDAFNISDSRAQMRFTPVEMR